MSGVVLAASGLTKRYGPVQVLSGVDLELRRGEVHALIGENGAGKSTLIKLLSGGVAPSEGGILVDGVPKVMAAPADARRAGIVTIFQELTIVPELSVAENVVLGNAPGVGPGRQIFSRRRAEAIATEMLAKLNAGHISPRTIAGRLSTAERQVVEIARALAMDAQVVIMDEPTASLSPREADALLDAIRKLRSDGKAILFVSHRLNEVLAIADRITVLRGGQRVATMDAAGLTADKLIETMIGQAQHTLYPDRTGTGRGPAVLKVEGLTRAGAFADVGFTLHRGEILGLAGLVGAGRSEIARAIFGADRFDRGRIEIDGQEVRFTSPAAAIRAGIGFVTEDRKLDGLILTATGRENLVLSSPQAAGSDVVIRRGRIRAVTDELRRELSVRGSLDLPVENLSGGNQQKILIGRWLPVRPKILIVDEPTRGIDIGAKAEVYRLLARLASEGTAIPLISSELPELLNLAHRILVVSGGRIEEEFTADAFDEGAILRAAFRAHLGRAA